MNNRADCYVVVISVPCTLNLSERNIDFMEHTHDHHNHDSADYQQAAEPHETSHNHSGGMHAGHATLMRNRFWVSLVLSVPVLLYSATLQQLLGFTAPEVPLQAWIPAIFSTVIYFYGGIVFLQMARDELRQRQPGMMTLVAIAITVAYVYSLAAQLLLPEADGFFWELATLVDVMLLGHWIEMRSVGQAQGALNELAKLLPDEAERILDSGETETVAMRDLKAGDRILVRPGASIPADGTVYEGQSKVNEAMITGESRPVDKQPGDEVIGGTVNQSNALRVEIAKVGDETALSGIMRLVEEAQNSKSNAQTLAQRAAMYLTYIAIAAGIITLVAWLLIAQDVPVAVRFAVTVIVIACPHALGLAVPLVVSISTSMAARNGLLVRDRLALETARELDVIIFDKTGTLTKGEQGVVGIATASMPENDALAIAAGIEGDSEHPIARAIRDRAAQQDVSARSISKFENLPGRGVTALVGGQPFFIGGPRLLEQEGWSVPDALQAAHDEAERQGQAVVYLATEDGPVAMFAIADVIREESYQAVRQLHDMGIKVAMLTGDSEAVAKAVAETLNIDTYFAEVLPDHKAEKVESLQRDGQRVAMVGDGVNDAPALVTADVGIAIGAGTDVAIESAGIILVKSNPLDIVKILRLSRATYAKMRQNLVWATGYNVVAIPLAMGLLAPIGITLAPAVGAALMSVSTVIVAINAQLLRRAQLVAEA
jgi:Cu2+-exporting ATPase